ncbi:MAG: NUDIX hydrolase [Nanoarchaeota archaeon]
MAKPQEKINIGKYDKGIFSVLVLGIIYNPKEKKILIGKRENDPDVPELTWSFPGGRPKYNEELENAVKREIKEETNLDVESLGSIFAKVYPEKKDFLAIYYLCEKISDNKEIPGDNFSELKWVSPEELEKYFTTSFHPRLKEYILNLK